MAMAHWQRRTCVGGHAHARVRASTVVVHAGTQSVVITGASSGIGKATALLMARKGWQVYAGVRQPSDGATLVQLLSQAQPEPETTPGTITPVIIDVLKPNTITAAAEQVRSALLGLPGQPQLTGLVNNAGKVTLAPLEHMPVDVFEDQIQVNLVGALRVTQAFLPLMRPNTAGTANNNADGPRIINISSQSGTVAYPLFGAYAASKFGLEALSDSLRYELHSQGIHVICIQPGPIKSDIWSRANDTSNTVLDALPASAKALYGDIIGKITRASQKAEEKGAACDEVAELIGQALSNPKPRARYMFGKSAIVQMVARKLLPDRIWDPLVISSLNKL